MQNGRAELDRVKAAVQQQHSFIGARGEKYVLNALRWKVVLNADSEEVLPLFPHSRLNDASEEVHF